MPMRASDATWLERDVLPLLESLAGIVKPVAVFEMAATSTVAPQSISSADVVNAQVQRTALTTRLAETTSAIKRRLEGRQKPATAEVHRMSRNPAVEHYSADVDGQKVPYIDISRWPCIWSESGQPEQVYPCIEWIEEGRAHDVCNQTIPAYSYEPRVLWDGGWCWTVTVGDLFMYDFECREDVELVLPILAQGMAVAAGFTSHGPRSFPKNAHGPAVGLAPFPNLPESTL
jgi:hypothetical protein